MELKQYHNFRQIKAPTYSQIFKFSNFQIFFKPLHLCFFTLFCVAFFFFSCNEKVVIIPAHVLSKDTMASILTDIQIEEAILSKKGINDSTPKDSILIQYGWVLKKHIITQKEFETSYNFYKENPEMLEEIYDKVINNISEMQAVLTNTESQ